MGETTGNAAVEVKSVLGRIDSGQIFTDPYPHLVIENALPESYYLELERGFPTLDGFRAIAENAKPHWPEAGMYEHAIQNLGRANRRVNLPYAITSRSSELGEPWHSFLSYHTSAAFFCELLRAFGEYFAALYPDVRLDQAAIGRRWVDDRADVLLDALLAVNTPVASTGSVKPPHTDNNDKLIAGLLYFADPEDTAGGDLIIHRRRKPATRKDTKWPAAADITEVRRIPYRANTFVLLLNSDSAVHGTSARRPTHYPRRFVNIVAQTSRPLFNPPFSLLGMRLPSLFSSWSDRRRRKTARKKSRREITS